MFSNTNKRSEISEWKALLNNEKEATRKEAVKKVIAAMTVGKDVSSLFSDVIKCVQTNNIEMKKLVYLYIMNYAKTKPELAILAVNTFEKDSTHPNPLIRGLAVRTMGCIRVDRIVEYLAEPLRRSVKDKDPYVRKTAAVAIAKLFDLNKQMAIDQGFVECLEDLLTDDNPMVVANAVKSLSEIAENCEEVELTFNPTTVKSLLAALNDCTEWGQVFILDAMSTYDPSDEREASTIAERVTPRLQHANSAVVLSAVKVITRCMDLMHNENEVRQLSKKMAAPLVTLLSAEPEIQYVALRNIDIIVQKYPNILSRDVKMFFCKYKDPIYVKLEKLEIMIKLTVEENIDAVLMEFKEYATEIDVEFVRRSVRAIGRCAIKLDRAAQRCIDVLLELIKTKVNYVVQEAIIVIKDIFRKYPNRYEKIIGQLCENLDTLDEPEAKASMIWIIGEYASRIEGADELLEVFVDTFHDETVQVQLQLLTATMKLFLTNPTPHTKELVTQVLTLSTEESDNPDLRDRGYVYWRLLSADPQAANTVVLAEKPVINDDSTTLSDKMLVELVDHIGTLASVYHKPPELFVPEYAKTKRERFIPSAEVDEEDEEDGVYESSSGDVDMLGFGTGDDQGKAVSSQMETEDLGLDDFLGGGGGGSGPSSAQRASPMGGMGGMGGMPASIPPRPVNKVLLLSADKGKGVQVVGCVTRTPSDELVYQLSFENRGQDVQPGLAIMFNKNTFGIAPSRLQVPPLNPGQSFETQLGLGLNPAQVGPKVDNVLQVALKTAGGVVYWQDQYDFTCLLKKSGKVSENEFLAIWGSLPEDAEISSQFNNLITSNEEALKIKLASHNVFYVAKQDVPEIGSTNLYFSAKVDRNNQEFVVVSELVVSQRNPSACTLSVRCADQAIATLFAQAVQKILSA